MCLFLWLALVASVACQSSPAWKTGLSFHIELFVSSKPHLSANLGPPEEYHTANLHSSSILAFNDTFTYDFSEDNYRTKIVNHNGTFSAHAFVFADGYGYNKLHAQENGLKFDRSFVLQRSRQLNVYLRNMTTIVRNLLFDPSIDEQLAIQARQPYVSYLRPRIGLTVVSDETIYADWTQASPWTRAFTPRPSMSPTAPWRYPPVFFLNTLPSDEEHYIPLNQSVTSVELQFSYEPMTVLKWSWMADFEASAARPNPYTGSNKEMRDVKRLFTETSIFVLYSTIGVAVLHLLFDILAFKNDISFWRRRKTMEGLSSRSILLNALSNTVIAAYLWDNDASWLVLISIVGSVLVDVWKLTKAFLLKPSPNFPYFVIEERMKSESSNYDQMAFRYLGLLLLPVIVAYSSYTLWFEKHKSWFSWGLGSLVSLVYAFGFINMTPQLFINYKMKSVAHLPWRVFGYKAMNTFIDDLFAWIIKMPTMHRLSVLRDDLVFVIYLYQRWIYPVDKARVNEFGQSFEDEKEDAVKKEQ